MGAEEPQCRWRVDKLVTYNIYRFMTAPKVTPLPRKPPHPGTLMARIWQLAKQGSYSWGPHVFDRSDERDIDLPDAVEVCRLGEIDGPITPGVNPGEWKCKVTAKLDGLSRTIGVVLVVIRNEELFFTTVEWEDIK